MKKFLIALLLAISLFASIVPVQATCPGSYCLGQPCTIFYGRMWDAYGNYLQGVDIHLWWNNYGTWTLLEEKTSDSVGYFAFSPRCEPELYAEYIKSGYQTIARGGIGTYSADCCASVWVDKGMYESNTSIWAKGRTWDYYGNYLSNVFVYCYPTNGGGSTGYAYSDSVGYYQIPHLGYPDSASNYQCSFSKSGYQTAYENLGVGSGYPTQTWKDTGLSQ